MQPPLKVIGLMSGTSLDGLDLALVEIYESRGKFRIQQQAFASYPYEKELRERIRKNLSAENASLPELSDLNFLLGKKYGEMVLNFCQENNLETKSIDLISSHGQTFFHHVEAGKTLSTLQLGDPSVIAGITGITTVGDFRTADVAAGGTGAPLIPFFDYHFFSNPEKNIALQNIGGIANVSFIPKNSDAEIIAFDNGPGNMVIDYLVQKITAGRLLYDQDGEISKKGNYDQELVEGVLKIDFFRKNPPKSTGRELFDSQFCENFYHQAKEKGLKDEDIVASATYLTAKSIYNSYRDFFPVLPDEIIISGGGAYNPVLVNYLQELCGKKVKISDSDQYGFSAAAKEAIAFALLGYCTVMGLTNNPPFATKAGKKVIMGKICPGENYQRILLKQNLNAAKNQEVTENNNLLSRELDELSPLEIVRLMNLNDYDVLTAVEKESEKIAAVIEEIISTFQKNGRLFYLGAGTSGRLGVLDASECPPTFKTPPEMVQGLIAGGQKALTTAVEGAEDDGEAGRQEIRAKVKSEDLVVGISANGKAPYVIEGLAEAKAIGAKTVLLTCNNLEKKEFIDQQLNLLVGPEVLSGSTRLKAGTVTKLVLNMFTTGALAKSGKVFGNYMVDLNVSNKKLKKRALAIIQTLTDIGEKEAEDLLEKAGNSVKLALMMQLSGIDNPVQAREILAKNKGFLRLSLGAGFNQFGIKNG